jgi:hypothetical protein
MHDLLLIQSLHRQESGAHIREAELVRSVRLARQAARMERWSARSARLSRRLAEMAKTRRLLAQ